MVEPFGLSEAIKKGFFSQCRFIIELGADINEQDEEKRTPMMLCALIEHKKWRRGIAQNLLEKGAKVGIRDCRGLNALHYACIYERDDLIKYYLMCIDYDLNCGDRLGHTALFYTANTGNLPCLRAVAKALKRYGLTVDKPNKAGFTPLMHAWRKRHIICAHALISEGEADDTNMRDKIFGRTAAEWEAESRKEMVLERSMTCSQLAKMRAQSAKPAKKNKLEKKVFDYREYLIEKDNKALLKLAIPTDMRHDPVHVFDLTPTDYFAEERMNTNRPESNEVESIGWRKDLGELYSHFEVQCTPSYRPPAKIPDNIDASECLSQIMGYAGSEVTDTSGSDKILGRVGKGLRKIHLGVDKGLLGVDKGLNPKELKKRLGSISGLLDRRGSNAGSARASPVTSKKGSISDISSVISKMSISDSSSRMMRPISRASNVNGKSTLRVPVV